MSSPDDPTTPSASQKLAALVAKRRSAGQNHPGDARGRQATERAAAATSASRSKPAPRKG